MTAPARIRKRVIGALLAAAWLCIGAVPGRADEITLYSTRETKLVEPVIAAFTETSGITVKLIFIEGNMVERLTSEGAASPADVLMTIGLDKTTQFSSHDLTQPLVSAILDAAVPSHLRGRDAQWVSLSIRPRIALMRGAAAIAAVNYEDLSDPRWHGKLCMRPALHQNNVAMISAYLVHHGAAATETWLRGLKANLAHQPAGKDNDVVREIAQGACDIGIGNTVALAQLRDGREGPEWTEWARAVKAIPTTFQGGGTHVNLTGAALARHAPHKAAALKFVEFLLTPAAQQIYAAAELEYPVMADAVPAPLVVEIGSFAADALPIDEIAAHQRAAIALIKKVGFDE
jgi:iron(III) transport system substrate-binding protein